MDKKILFRILLNSLIGVVLIFLWLQFVNLSEILQALSALSPLVIFPAVGLFVIIIIFRSIRLKLLLQGVEVPVKNLVLLNFLSQFLSFLIPIRAGELTKGVYLSTQYKVPLAQAVVVIFLDRFFDFWLVISLSLLLLILLPTSLPHGLINGLIAVLIVFTAAILSLAFFPNFFKKIGLLFSKLLYFKKLQRIFLQLLELAIDAIGVLRKGWKNIFLLIVLSLGAALSEALVWFILLKVFIPNLAYPITLLGSMLNALTFLIPAAPGYVGSAEAAGLAVFNLGLGMEKLGVSAATVAFHAITIIYMLIFGIGSLYFLKINLSKVYSKLKNSK